MTRVFDFRIPPAVFSHDHPGINTIVQLGTFLDPTPGRLDIDPVTILNSMLLRYFRMDFNNRIGPDFPLAFKISAQEFVPGGLTVKESIEILKNFKTPFNISRFLYSPYNTRQ